MAGNKDQTLPDLIERLKPVICREEPVSDGQKY